MASAARLCPFLIVLASVPGYGATEVTPEEAADLFSIRCTPCHTVGGGDDVGPDLEGVTERRDNDWLHAFIRSSQSVIQSGDPTAAELFERFDQEKMPDHEITGAQIDGILAFIEAGGPEKLIPTLRPSESATADELEMGRRLFFGSQPLSQSGTACAACHTLSRGSRWQLGGGSLGGNLINTYSKYHDVELAKLLDRLSSGPRAPASHPRVDETENLALRAFLRQIETDGGDRPSIASTFPWWGLVLGLCLATLGLRATRAKDRERGER